MLVALGIYPILNEKTLYLVLAMIIYFGLDYYLENTKYVILPEILLAIAVIAGKIYFPAIVITIYICAGVYKSKAGVAIIKMSIMGFGVMADIMINGRDFYIKLIQNNFWIWFGILVILAVYLALQTYEYNLLKVNTLKMQDDNEEFKQLMLQKNALQREKQNDEIDMATLRERNRIAREIHDNVGHLITRSILQMGALQAVYKEEPLNSSLKQVSDTLNESMQNIRQSVHDLHNDALDIEKAVKDIISKNEDYETTFYYDMGDDIKMGIKYALISIITECYQNVRKHSNATKIEIILQEHPGFYQLIFRDNGKNAKIKQSGIGLHNMESRINELGGNIEISIQNGFKIFATIPRTANIK